MRTRSATCPVGSGTAARREAEYVASEPTATRDRVWSIGKADCSGASIGAKIVGQVRITPVPPYTRHRGCRFRNSGIARSATAVIERTCATHTLEPNGWSGSTAAVDNPNERLLVAVACSEAVIPLTANRPMVRLHRDMPTVDPMRPRRGDEDDGIDANLFRRTKPPQRKSVPQRARPG
jgi:hypothetical protein